MHSYDSCTCEKKILIVNDNVKNKYVEKLFKIFIWILKIVSSIKN